MTIDEARQRSCPHKPALRNFEGVTLPTCEPEGCMCWVKTSNVTYTDYRWIDCERGTVHLDTNIYKFIKSEYPYRLYGIPHLIEQGYCTLRGDIDDTTTI